jgi:RNA polymerase sigma-70 factor, ECF subfamily
MQVLPLTRPQTMPDTSANTEIENALLLRVGSGDQQAFASYYDRMAGPLYSLALKMLPSEQEAQDALQEGMERLWRKAATFDPTRSAAFTWSVMVFRSLVLDKLRRSSSRSRTFQKAVEFEDPTALDDSTALQALFRQEDCSIVRRVLADLSAEQQHCLSLAFFTGLTQQQIAEELNKPLGTIKTIIRRALLELRQKLSQEGYPP